MLIFHKSISYRQIIAGCIKLSFCWLKHWFTRCGINNSPSPSVVIENHLQNYFSVKLLCFFIRSFHFPSTSQEWGIPEFFTKFITRIFKYDKAHAYFALQVRQQLKVTVSRRKILLLGIPDPQTSNRSTSVYRTGSKMGSTV